MNKYRILKLMAWVLICGAGAIPFITPAQDYPAKPLRMIVPGPAAGGADVVARALGTRMGVLLNQQVVIDNRPGANGQIATELVSKAPADGYTLILATSSAFTLNPNLGPVPYDPVKSFASIGMVATSPLLMVVHPSLPAKTVSDVIKLAKAKPGQLLYASNGPGSLSHLATELFRLLAGVDITHVPYKGGTPAVTDTVSGQTSLLMTALPTLMTQVRAMRVRPIAVSGLKRSGALPEVPTIAESGLKGFNAVQWYALFGPAGIPSNVITRLSETLVSAVSANEVREVLEREGLDGVAGSPRELASFLATDLQKWAAVVRQTGLKRN